MKTLSFLNELLHWSISDINTTMRSRQVDLNEIANMVYSHECVFDWGHALFLHLNTVIVTAGTFEP